MVLSGFFILTVILSALIVPLKNRTLNTIVSSFYAICVAFLSVYAFFHLNETDSLFFKFDALGSIFTAVLSILSFTTLYHSFTYLNRHSFSVRHQSIYFAALMLLTTAMIATYFCQNIILQWISIEATTLFVSLLIYHERSEVAVEASWKYLFVSSVGVAFAFIGILIMTVVANQSDIQDLNFSRLAELAKTADPIWLKVTFLLILTGYSAKMGIFPLHTVTVDAHTAAPPPVSAFISTTLMNVGFFGIFRVFEVIAGTSVLAWAQNVLFIVAVLSIFMSAVQLLKIKHFKRMFAFSSLEHMAIVTLGLAVGGIGYYAAILQLVLHSFTKASLFYQIDTAHSAFRSYWIKDAGDYIRINPAGALALLFGFVSIMAIPPSGLFISEVMVFKALFNGSYYIVAAIFLLFLTTIMYAFGKHILRLLFLKHHNKFSDIQAFNRFETLPSFVLLGLAAWLGFFPPRAFSELINAAINALI
jgi:hydrogenase-4 component F